MDKSHETGLGERMLDYCRPACERDSAASRRRRLMLFERDVDGLLRMVANQLDRDRAFGLGWERFDERADAVNLLTVNVYDNVSRFDTGFRGRAVFSHRCNEYSLPVLHTEEFR